MTRPQQANDRMVLKRFLVNREGHATVDEIQNECQGSDELKWTVMRIRAAVRWDTEHPDSRSELKFVPGGKGLRLVENSERVAEGRGAKAELVRAINGESSTARRIFGNGRRSARHIRGIETGRRAAPEHGSNSRPDIVVGSKFNESERRHTLHNIEFQGKAKNGGSTFTSADVAQAFTTGRGSDFSWVFIHKSSIRRKSDDKYDEWDRTLELAQRLGVGIVAYGDPRLVSTWRLILQAKKERRTSRSVAYHKWYLRLLDDLF